MIFPPTSGTMPNVQALAELFPKNKPEFFRDSGKYFIVGSMLLSIIAGTLAYLITYPMCKLFKNNYR